MFIQLKGFYLYIQGKENKRARYPEFCLVIFHICNVIMCFFSLSLMNHYNKIYLIGFFLVKYKI
jgi:hypothetical protein